MPSKEMLLLMYIFWPDSTLEILLNLLLSILPKAVILTIGLFTAEVTSVWPPITCILFLTHSSEISLIIFFISSCVVPTGAKIVTVIAKGVAKDVAISLRFTITANLPISFDVAVIGSEVTVIISSFPKKQPQSCPTKGLVIMSSLSYPKFLNIISSNWFILNLPDLIILILLS